MFIAALCTIDRRQNQTECHIYDGIVYSHKEKINMTFVRKCLELESIMLSEIS